MSLALQHALEKVLSPLARLLVGRGVTFGNVAELLKAALVREAQYKLAKTGGKTTDSRLSIITGVHRKDIKRLKEAASEPLPAPELSVPAQVVARWLGERKLRAKDGTPLPLPKKKRRHSEIDFEDLVRSVSTDIRPRAVLDELIDREVVRIKDELLLEINPNRLASNQDDRALSEYLGMNVHDHFSVAVNNLLRPQEAQLERCVHYLGLSEEAAKELAKFAEEKAMTALIAVNQKAQELIKSERNHGTHRINFGTYFFKEEIAAAATEESK